MKRKEFIKSLIGLPLLGLFGFDKKQEIQPAHKNIVDDGFKVDYHDFHPHNCVVNFKFPEPDPEALEELKRIAEQKVYAVYPDGEVIDVTGWKVTYINE